MALNAVTENVMLGDQFEITPGRRVPTLDRGLAEAFSAIDKHEPARKVFALIAPGHLICRGLALAGKRQASGSYLLWPMASGIVDWPIAAADGQIVWGRRPALVYTVPGGDRLAETGAKSLPQYSESNLVKCIIQPALATLRDLHQLGIAHRAIRPDNMFIHTDRQSEVMIGDCLAAPPGSDQPAAFEPVDLAMAEPFGRGPGTEADDLYALGVVLLMLHFGRNPMANLSEEQAVTAKINYGSFSALAGGEKLPPGLAEVLRGLLCDRAADRWSLTELEGWAAGQHFTPLLPNLPQRASRPFRFEQSEYFSRQALANAFSHHWEEALGVIEDPDLDNWIKRGFSDEKAGDVLLHLRGLAQAYGPSSGQRDRYLARLIVYLGGALPLAFRKLRCNLTGMGVLLAHNFDHQDHVQNFADLFRGRLPQAWLEGQSGLRPEHVQTRRVLETIEKIIEKPGPGYGMERVLYELDPGMPCRSPLIADFYVTDLKDLLPAIDAAIPGAPSGTLPMDRHIAAFIATNVKRSIDTDLTDLAGKPETPEHRVAVLQLLAVVHRQHPVLSLPRLAQALADMLEPVIESFHNIPNRQKVRDQIKELASECRLEEMLALVDKDGQTRLSDEVGFMDAVQRYARLGDEAKWIETGGFTNVSRVREIAQRTAAASTALMSSACVAAYSLYAVLW